MDITLFSSTGRLLPIYNVSPEDPEASIEFGNRLL